MADGASYLRSISDEIVALQRPVKILKAINWSPRVHERFFKHGARELPTVRYAPLPFEPHQLVRDFLRLKRKIRGRNEVEDLLRRKCDEFTHVVRMLAARGTRRFFEHSILLYGDPRDRYADPTIDNLEIARLWASRHPARHEEPSLEAEQVAEVIRGIVEPVLGAHCRVRLSSRLTANAAAGATSVAIRKGARFSPKQARALAHHEGLWHVLTSLNGYAQPVLTVLGVGLPRFTESQEGCGILAEFLTGNLTDDRFIELGERTLAVDMAARGADYLQVYRSLCEKFPPQKAAQMGERVFRGGLLTGGAPFTKDASYQRGYCRTYQFLRSALNRVDRRLVLAFLAGKMNVDDAPLIKQLIADGTCVEPRYLPTWFVEEDRLSAEFTHSVTMDRFSAAAKAHLYAQRLEQGEAFGLRPIDLPRAAKDQ
jgi:uncharacterized protein (TIGR02421 family)